MEQKPFLSLIIPAYNEEKRLPECIEKLVKYIQTRKEPVEVLLVENGSTDLTLDMALDYQKQYPWLQVFHEEKAGKGNAVRRGMLLAQGDYRMFADVDFAMPIELIDHFIPPELENFDLSIASREADGSIQKNDPLIRRLSSRIFNIVIELMLGLHIRDTQCGFKCFTARAAEKIFRVQTVDGWAFDVEVLTIARHYGFTITEVPVTIIYEEGSKVKLWSAVPKMLRDIFRIRKMLKSGRYD